MKTIPIARPGAGPAPTASSDVQASQARREAAIAKLTGSQPAPQHAQSPIPTNPNQVSVEEMGSVQSLQNNSSVEDQVSSEAVEVTTEEVRQVSKPAESKVETETALSNSQMAILARKERALRAKAQQQEQAIKSERDAWTQEKAKYEQRLQELETGYIPKSNLKQAALEALQRGEISYEEMTQEIMNPMDQRAQSAITRLEQRIAEQDKKLASYEKNTQDASSQQYQAAIKQIGTDVNNLVKADPAYEMIKHTGSQRDVVELIEQTFKEDGYVMTVEEAAQQVEDYLVEEAFKLAKVSKIQKRLSPAAVVKKADEGQMQTPNTNKQPQPMKTLTNTNAGSRKLSNREKAILAFKGELKS